MLVTQKPTQIPYLTSRCQRFNVLGNHSASQRVFGRIGQGLGIKTRLLNLLHYTTTAPSRSPLGIASKFAVGDWVRVRDQESIRRTLDGTYSLRGLLFTLGQWSTCSKVYRVSKHVLRIIDDRETMRSVSRTVLLNDVDCGAATGAEGCGRFCPMMYKDDWLEHAEPPLEDAQPIETPKKHARVRPAEEIVKGLDLLGQRDGLLFYPEMAQYAGLRFPIFRELSKLFEYYRWVDTKKPFYILEGLNCTGEILGHDGPCHRACRMLWHSDWLEIDN